MQRFVDELKKYKGLTLPMALRLIHICGEMVKAEANNDPKLKAVKERLHGYTEALEDTGALPWEKALDLKRALPELVTKAVKDGVTGNEHMEIKDGDFKTKGAK